jgi:hypothetical protein
MLAANWGGRDTSLQDDLSVSRVMKIADVLWSRSPGVKKSSEVEHSARLPLGATALFPEFRHAELLQFVTDVRINCARITYVGRSD